MIYTVWNLQTQTEQVLKVLVETAPKAQELFQQEAEILQSLRHPAVPRVDSDGYFQLSLGNPPTILPCLIMEKINGQTLEEVSASYPQGCPEAWVLNWFQQAVEILRELHKRHIIHRDLKPSNLMLRQETNQLVIIDFGGAKKIRPAWFRSKDSSTRLFSPGYSPPEQSQGLQVEPAADFYALGRTMIQLLTGKSPAELADPVTGKLRWRSLARVSPVFADILDELVQEDVSQRPTVAKIQQHLAPKLQQSKQRVSSGNNQKRSPATLDLTKRLSKTARFLLKAIAQIGRGCLDTIKAMIMSAIAACIGTTTGFLLAYFSPLGTQIANFLTQQFPDLTFDAFGTSAEIIVFATAGLATAWGLTLAGGFGQRRRYLTASLVGLCGYVLGWLVWLALTPYSQFGGIAGAIAVAVTILTVGLGLPSHYLVHAVVTAVSTTTIFVVLLSLNLIPTVIFHLSNQLSWLGFWQYITFFSFVSVSLSLWLGISSYLVVPCLRWLGWR